MPVRRRLAAVRDRAVDPMVAFVWAGGDDFSETILGDPGFASRAEAEKTWPSYRRRLWAVTHRFHLPRPAQVFDGLTLSALDDLRSRWGLLETFKLAPSLEHLALDRSHLAAHAATKGGRSIADFLDLLRVDLDAIEATARSLASLTGPSYERPYPHHLGSKFHYGSPQPETQQ